ncbi:MAG: hypothetical protein K0Q95_136 [Bacteroidota bacterium]|jgi:hypothetical protein|nr:hypothetical protein [Bacteroidota bacterium]
MFLKSNNHLPLFLLFLIVFLSRLPFISAGYGVEEDSWGIALAAFHTKMSGIYEPSRFPGHPVQELVYSALWGSGPVVYNILTAFFSSIAALFFAFILKHFNFRCYFLAALAFAFTPVVYISSSYTIDFMWSEAFVLMSFYFLLRNRLVLSGVLLGLAVGCRITCGVMIIPFMMIIWQINDLKMNFKSLLKISIPMALTALVAFLPVIIQFGSSFFMYYDQFPYPPMTKVLYKMTIGVFGLIGIITICIFLIYILIRKRTTIDSELFSGLNKRVIYASVLIIILYLISYFRLPQKSGYLIPVIPFVIILFGYYLNARAFKIFCCLLIASSFFCSINLTDKLRGAAYSDLALKFSVSGQEVFFDPVSGPVFSDLSKRVQKMQYTDEVIEKALLLNPKTVIISGWWYNEIMVTMIEEKQQATVVFEPYIPEQKMKEYIQNGYSILYLPEQNIYNDLMYKIHSTELLTVPF